jgi:prevent-host-death family protein
MHEAKTHLSRLVERAAAGEEVVIAKAGRPVARLVALEDRSQRTPGFWKEKIAVADDWDSPEINKEIEDLFHRDESGE